MHASSFVDDGDAALTTRTRPSISPHAGGVGLCEYVIHLSMIDYLCVSGSYDVNVLE